MDSSHLTGQVRRIGIAQCSRAGNICLHGFSCEHSHSSERHPSSRFPRATGWSSRCISASVALFIRGQFSQQAHPPSSRKSETTSRHAKLQPSSSTGPQSQRTRFGYLLPVLFMQGRLIVGASDHRRRSQTGRRDHQESPWDIDWVRTPVSHTLVSVERMSAKEDCMAWLAARTPDASNGMLYHLESSSKSWCLGNQRANWISAWGRKEVRRWESHPWPKGKCPAWNVTVPDTYADSHQTSTISVAGSAASEIATYKSAKYSSTPHFVPWQSRDVWSLRPQSRWVYATGRTWTHRGDWGDQKETRFTFEQISVAFQRQRYRILRYLRGGVLDKQFFYLYSF